MKKFYSIAIMLVFVVASHAQHEHHHMADTTKPGNKEKHDMNKMDTGMHAHHMMSQMPSHAYSRNLPMNRNGSGTSWLPDATPMYMIMKTGNKTDWMFHGNVFLRYTNTDIFNNGNRGSDKFDAPNWFMAMMNHKVGKKGLLNATAMMITPITLFSTRGRTTLVGMFSSNCSKGLPDTAGACPGGSDA